MKMTSPVTRPFIISWSNSWNKDMVSFSLHFHCWCWSLCIWLQNHLGYTKPVVNNEINYQDLNWYRVAKIMLNDLHVPNDLMTVTFDNAIEWSSDWSWFLISFIHRFNRLPVDLQGGFCFLCILYVQSQKHVLAGREWWPMAVTTWNTDHMIR